MGLKSRQKRDRHPDDDGRWHTTFRDGVLWLGKRPTTAKEAWVAQHRDRLQRGGVTQIVESHEPDCPAPKGFKCSCIFGPTLRVAGDQPESN